LPPALRNEIVDLQEIAALVHQCQLTPRGELEGSARALVAINEVQVLLHVVAIGLVCTAGVQVRGVQVVEQKLSPHMDVCERKLVNELLHPPEVVQVLIEDEPRRAWHDVIDVHHAQDL